MEHSALLKSSVQLPVLQADSFCLFVVVFFFWGGGEGGGGVSWTKSTVIFLMSQKMNQPEEK